MIKKIEDNIIKDVRNLFRLNKEIDDTRIKDVLLNRIEHEYICHRSFLDFKPS